MRMALGVRMATGFRIIVNIRMTEGLMLAGGGRIVVTVSIRQ